MNDNTIGKTIGTIKHTCSIAQYKGGPSTQITVGIDFTTSTDADIKSWLVSNRVIAGQRPWRTLDESELIDLNGQTFIAQNIGQKVKSRSDQIQEFKNAFMSAGIDESTADNLAIAAVDNPSALNVTPPKDDTPEEETYETEE